MPDGAPRIVVIAAIAENGVIGRGLGIPWRIPSDLRRFRALTIGKPVVMGRRTFLSLGRPLPGRTNVVVTSDPSFRPEGVVVAASFPDALEVAWAAIPENGPSEICVIGGAALYGEALPVADRLEITRVHAAPEGDVHFPRFDRAGWRLAESASPERGDRDDHAVTYETWERIVPARKTRSPAG